MSWLFRIIGFIGGITFIGGGLDVATAKGCDSVTFGGSRRSSTYTCFPGGEGEFSAGLAAAGMIALGVLMLVIALWPLLKLLDARRAESAEISASGLTRAEWNAKQDAYAMDLMRAMGEERQRREAAAAAVAAPQERSAAPTPQMSVQPSDGWRADPTGRYEYRRWDGSAWTDHVRTGGREFVDPID